MDGWMDGWMDGMLLESCILLRSPLYPYLGFCDIIPFIAITKHKMPNEDRTTELTVSDC